MSYFFNFDSGAPEFDGSHYDPNNDPYIFRQENPVYMEFTETKKYSAGKSTTGPKGVILYSELRDAFLGLVEHASKPPVACYSISGTLSILQTKHGLNSTEAELALDQLKSCNLGPETPCFLDSSSIE